MNLTVLGTDIEGDSARQISQMEDRIAQGDDAIIFAAQDTKALIPTVELANAAGIPVIAVDKTTEGGKVESVIMTDNVAAGAIGARWVAEQIGGKGTVLVLEGVPGNQTADDRKTGAHMALAEYPGIEVISLAADWQTSKGQAVTEDVLTAHPDLAGVFGSNDLMAMGAQAAAAAQGLDIPICGFDAIDAALEMVADGRLGATVAQYSGRMGFLGVEYAVRAIEGQEVPEFVDTGAMLVDKNLVNAFKVGLYGNYVCNP